MLFFLLINVKMPIVVGILTFMSWKIFMFSCVEQEKRFITSGPEHIEFMAVHSIRRVRGEK